MTWQDILKKQFRFQDIEFKPYNDRRGYHSRTEIAPDLELSVVAGDRLGSIPHGKLQDPHSYKAYEIAFIDTGEDDTPFVTVDLFGGNSPKNDTIMRLTPEGIESFVDLAIMRFKEIKDDPTTSAVKEVKRIDFEQGFSRGFQDKNAMES
jgi:hypothetical protein